MHGSARQIYGFFLLLLTRNGSQVPFPVPFLWEQYCASQGAVKENKSKFDNDFDAETIALRVPRHVIMDTMYVVGYIYTQRR